MKLFSILFLPFLAFQLNAQNWLASNDYPSNGVDDGTAFVIGNKAYCGTGVVDWFASQRNFYAFDYTKDAWSTVAAMPTGEERQYANGFASDSFGYVFGGYNGSFLSDLWRYDSQNNQWQEMEPMPDSGRGGAASFVVDSIAYIIGGKTDSNSAINEVWAYNMNSDSWTQKNNLPFGTRWRSSSCSSNGFGYLGFGLDSARNYHSGFYEYNPLTDSWNLISLFPTGGRNYVQMQCFDSKLIMIAGMDSTSKFLNECWSFDLQSKNWTKLDSIPSQGRRGGMSFKSNSAIYYTTGLAANGTRLTETWKMEKPTSIQENRLEKQLTFYPNPAETFITVEYKLNPTNGTSEYHIHNIQGQLVQTGILNKLKTEVNITRLKPGLYFITISSGKEKIVKKVIKK